MKASSLRIGNLLMGSGDTPLIVTRIFNEDKVGTGKGDPYTVSGESPCLLPIPLTEDWLLKFGFEEKPKYSHPKYWKGNYFCNLNGEFYTNNESYEGETLSTNIKYVHQLQNLYFALTGEELEIKN